MMPILRVFSSGTVLAMSSYHRKKRRRSTRLLFPAKLLILFTIDNEQRRDLPRPSDEYLPSSLLPCPDYWLHRSALQPVSLPSTSPRAHAPIRSTSACSARDASGA